MKKSEWGPHIWKTIHCLTIRIKDDHFEKLKPQLMNILSQICSNLPCPTCSSHASTYMRKYRFKHINTKEQLIRFFYQFHNEVNKRLHKKNISYEDMIKIHEKVNFKNTLSTYYNIHHQIKFSERLMNHGFHRKLFLEQFKTFVRSNIDCFHY
uniref:thiol oxidase n=1 Tax=viral metagenome TaxID=1070528 RepID=A0A6C0KN64_9ZZZZ